MEPLNHFSKVNKHSKSKICLPVFLVVIILLCEASTKEISSANESKILKLNMTSFIEKLQKNLNQNSIVVTK